jgi:hypothetical protein
VLSINKNESTKQEVQIKMEKYKKAKFNEFYNMDNSSIEDNFEDQFINDDDMDEELTDWELGFQEGYDSGYSDALNHVEPDMFESVEKMNEAEFDVSGAIDDFIKLQWHTDDEARGKVSNILKGLLFSDDPNAKKFVKDLDEMSNKLKVEDYK